MPPIRSAPHYALWLFAIPLLTGCDDSSTEPDGPAVHDADRMVTTASNGEPGVVTEVLIEAQDTEGRPFAEDLPGLAMEVRGANAAASTELANLGGGSHALRYTPTVLGFDTLDVMLDGDPVPGSPFASRVRLVFLSGVGTPTLDGVMDNGEWDDAPSYNVFSGPLQGSTVRFLADGDNLYFLFRVPHPEGTAVGTASVRFDNTLDLVLSGDDVVSLQPPSRLIDQFFGSASITNDLQEDGAGAAGSSGLWAYFEFRHPLSSGQSQDVDLAWGDRAGVCLVYGSELTTFGDEFSFPAGCFLVISQQRTYAELVLPPL